jgi:hypothetical protein
MKPRQYLAVATSVPANSFYADKSRIFSENIQALYPALGTTDDLDMVLGTAQLDTVYLFVADQFNLFDHYKMGEKGRAARIKAAFCLKSNTKVMKSEYGELKVKVWDTDKNLAPQLANAIMDKLQSMHQDLHSYGNRINLGGLVNGRNKAIEEIDSINLFLGSAIFPPGVTESYTEKLQLLKSQLARIETLISEYELLLSSKPPVLIVVEKASPPEWPDKPKRMKTLVATAVLAILFSLLAAIILERRKLIKL